MAWNETAQGQQGRPAGRHETDLTDEGRAVIEPFIPPPGSRMGHSRELDVREDFDAGQLRPAGSSCAR